MWILGLKGLSKGVFERRTSTGSEVFSLIVCLDATKFVLVSVVILVETIWLKIWAKSLPQERKRFTSGCRASLKSIFSR